MRKARNIRTQRANKGLFGSDIGEEVEQVDEKVVPYNKELLARMIDLVQDYLVDISSHGDITEKDYKSAMAVIKKIAGDKVAAEVSSDKAISKLLYGRHRVSGTDIMRDRQGLSGRKKNKSGKLSKVSMSNFKKDVEDAMSRHQKVTRKLPESVEHLDEKVRPLEMTQAKYDSYPKNKKGKSGGKLYIIQNQKSGVTKGGVKFTSLGGGAGTTKVPVKIVKERPYKYEESVEQTEGYVGSTGKDTDIGHLAARHYQHTIYKSGQRDKDYHGGKNHVAAIKSIEGKIKQHHGADAVKAVRKHSKQADSYDDGKGNNSFHKSFAQKHLGGAGSNSHKKYMAGLPKSATHPYLNKESVEQTDEMSNKLLNRYSDAAKKDSKKDRAKGMRKARNIRTQRANKGLWGSDIGEEVEQFEGLNHDRYLRSHGKKAKGHGRWSFTTMRTGTPNEKDVLTATGKLGDVANIAQRNFKGKDIYVMESVEQTDEAYTVAQRIKAKQRMKKMSKRIQMAKKRAMKRAPSTEKLKLRARKQAKGALVAKWSKGKQKGELSFAQRQNIEKRLKSASGRIDTMSKKLLPDVRKQDRERRSNAKNKSEEK
jgi:hypothetical protein